MKPRSSVGALASSAVGWSLLLVGQSATAALPASGGVAFLAERERLQWHSAGDPGWPAVAERLPVVGPLCELADGSLVVAVKWVDWVADPLVEDKSPRTCSLYSIRPTPEDRPGRALRERWQISEIETNVPVNEVRDIAASAEGAWLTTDEGVLHVDGLRADLFKPARLPIPWGHMPPVPRGWGFQAQRIEVDAAGWAWVAGGGLGLFQTKDYQSAYAYSLVGVPLVDMAASRHLSGAWVLAGGRPRGGLTVVHLKLSGPLAPKQDPAGKQRLPEEYVPIRPPSSEALDGGPDLPLSAPLAAVHMATDSSGRVWIAGPDEAGAVLLVCDENGTCERKTAFGQLLGKTPVTDIAVADSGKVYFATDGLGVVVFDGNEFRLHAMNEHLPVLRGTDRKPVNYVLPLSDGRVAVCTGEYLLIWSAEDQPKQR